MSSRRLVIDTGIAVSALILSRSVPRQAFNAARSWGQLLISPATFNELEDVLCRPKLERFITEQERVEFLDAYVLLAKAVAITESITACRDPNDDKFLELAVSGQAECIISGDADLLVLSPFRLSDADSAIDIVTPRAFLEDWLPSKSAS